MRTMKANKWAIIALQETHESALAARNLESFNSRVWTFPDPGSHNAAGTMFVVSKDLLPVPMEKDGFTHEILVKGRADRLTFNWRGEEDISIVNLYAPNNQADTEVFFHTLRRKLHRKPSMVMDDFNHIEAVIDRQPLRCQPSEFTKLMLRDFRQKLQLVDGWRHRNENVNSFTGTSPRLNADGSRSRSRLDRILVARDLMPRSMTWDHKSSLS